MKADVRTAGKEKRNMKRQVPEIGVFAPCVKITVLCGAVIMTCLLIIFLACAESKGLFWSFCLLINFSIR